MSTIKKDAWRVLNYLCGLVEKGDGTFTIIIDDEKFCGDYQIAHETFIRSLSYLHEKKYIDAGAIAPTWNPNHARSISVSSAGIDFAEGVV